MSTVKLHLDYYHPWSNNAGFYLARERGYYLDHGLDVEIFVSDPFRGDSIARVAHAEGEFAVNYTNRLLVQRELGVRVRSVAALNRGPLEALMSLPDRNIERPKDLEGKRVGIPRSPRLLALLRHLVQKDGGDPDRVSPVEYFPPEPLPTDIAAGDVDATLGTLWAWEAPLGRAAGIDPVVIKTEDIGSPRFHAMLLITRETLVERNPVLVRNFLEATKRGFTDVQADIDAGMKVLLRAAPYFTPGLLIDALEVTAPTWGGTAEWGRHTHKYMEGYAEFLKDVGLIHSLDPLSGSYGDELLS